MTQRTLYYNALTGVKFTFNFNYSKPKFILYVNGKKHVLGTEGMPKIILGVADYNTIMRNMNAVLHKEENK